MLIFRLRLNIYNFYNIFLIEKSIYKLLSFNLSPISFKILRKLLIIYVNLILFLFFSKYIYIITKALYLKIENILYHFILKKYYICKFKIIFYGISDYFLKFIKLKKKLLLKNNDSML